MKSSIRDAVESGLADCGLPESAYPRILARVKNAITKDMLEVLEMCAQTPMTGLECMAKLGARWNVAIDSEGDGS